MTDKTQPTAHGEITAPISADLRRIEQDACEIPEPSPTAGMNLGQRILHVGGRENAAGYIEFGSVAAVRALVGQVLRDLPSQAAAKCLHRADAAHDPAIEKPEAGRYVLAWTEGAKVPIRAMWAPQFFLEMADDDAESGEYCEAKDQYFCPEGWYENNAHEEAHWNVDRPVIAWTELPRLDAALQAAPPAPAAVAVPELRLADEQIEQAFISARDEFMLREVERTDKNLRLAFGRAVLKAALAAAPAQAVAVPQGEKVYAELPGSAGDSVDFGNGNIDIDWGHPAPAGGTSLYTADQMRDFADVTHALRAPAQEHATQLAAPKLHDIDVGVEAMAWPNECDSPDLCQVHRGCAGQYGTKNTCPSFAVFSPCNPASLENTQTAGAPSREEIACLRAIYGITSNGRGIKEFEQVASFARDVLARWGCAPAQAHKDEQA